MGGAGEYVSAAKKLLDTSNPAYKWVSSVKSQIVSCWRTMSLPYPEPGIRLIRQDDIASFQVQMTSLQESLASAVEILNSHYADLRARPARDWEACLMPRTTRPHWRGFLSAPGISPASNRRTTSASSVPSSMSRRRPGWRTFYCDLLATTLFSADYSYRSLILPLAYFCLFLRLHAV